MSEPFVIAEAAACEHVGIPQVRFREARQRACKENVDFVLLRGRITYTVPGLVRVLAAMGVDDPEKNIPLPSAAAPAGDPGDGAAPGACTAIVKLDVVIRDDLVVERFYLNQQILGCKLGDKVVMVKVASARNFKKGMKLKARRIAGELWQLEGRCPRWPGKW